MIWSWLDKKEKKEKANDERKKKKVKNERRKIWRDKILDSKKFYWKELRRQRVQADFNGSRQDIDQAW